MMKLPFFLKGIVIGVPIGITFIDCVGYVARVEGNFFVCLTIVFVLKLKICV